MALPGTTSLPTTANLNGTPTSKAAEMYRGYFCEHNVMKTKKGIVMKSSGELHQELRQRILDLPGVTERPNAGIHEDAFFVGRTMFMHIHGHGHCDIRLAKGLGARSRIRHIGCV